MTIIDIRSKSCLAGAGVTAAGREHVEGDYDYREFPGFCMSDLSVQRLLVQGSGFQGFQVIPNRKCK